MQLSNYYNYFLFHGDTEGVESGFAPINSSLMYGRSKSPRFALMRVHFSLKQLTLSIYLTIISKIRLSLVCLWPTGHCCSTGRVSTTADMFLADTCLTVP